MERALQEGFSREDINARREEAIDYLLLGGGWPRSWEDVRRLWEHLGLPFDECPAIAGYEALEAEGFAERVPDPHPERVHFRITDAGRAALPAPAQKDHT